MIFERGDFNSQKVEKGNIKLSLSESRNFSFKGKSESKPTIFISHKHSDLEDLRGVIGLFEKLGAKIYIDSMDNKMPKETSGETAKRIKEVIKHSKKFILLATENAIESYWCNWELGIGDTHKFINHIAILPMKENGELDSNYKGNEYLQIYPKLHYRKKSQYNIYSDFIEKGYYIQSPKSKEGEIHITPIKDWLNN
jgi:hypothetical protein